MEKSEMANYDGVLFLPTDDEDGFEFRFIQYKQDFGPAVEFTEIGEKYHVAFFRRDEAGDFTFYETFEAIFSDPLTYIRNLAGCNLFGTMAKKKANTTEWFETYLTDMKTSVTMMTD